MRKLELRPVATSELYEVEQLSAERRTITVGDKTVTVFVFKSWDIHETTMANLRKVLTEKFGENILCIGCSPDAEFEIFELDPAS
jgi:hypothetical protein